MMTSEMPHCKYFIKKKKRYCSLMVGKDRLYCGEHENNLQDDSKDKKLERIVCPLDDRHTVYACKLQKHLKICNSRPPKVTPKYINLNLNRGIADDDTLEDFELKNLPPKDMEEAINCVNEVYERHFNSDTIQEMFDKRLEIDIEEGKTKTKHVDQVAALLGIAKFYNLLVPDTCFIEFGAGKGELAYHIAKTAENLTGTNRILLVDRSTFRNKKDNKLGNRDLTTRIKADIKDLDLKGIELAPCKQFIGMSKHLCGVATDLALRCMVNSNKSGEKLTKGFVIALCCHHRTTYGDFTGKDFLEKNGIDAKMFKIITKMTSWNTCGSRTTEENNPEAQEKSLIGWKSKRLIDFARKTFMEMQGFMCDLRFYVKSETTLENVCLIGCMK